MQTFKIEIKETLSRIIEVQAESMDAAINHAKDLYHAEEIVLDENDLVVTEIEEFQSWKNEISKTIFWCTNQIIDKSKFNT